ncbi:MAG: hypothetical protein AABX85_03320 [Nanoarchaeota archaeon]
MRKVALMLALIGMVLLAANLYLSKPIEISSQNQLSKLQDNQKVSVSGKVIDENIYSNSRTLILDNNLTLYCNCNNLQTLKEKNIQAIGIIDTFQKTKINILKIKW